MSYSVQSNLVVNTFGRRAERRKNFEVIWKTLTEKKTVCVEKGEGGREGVGWGVGEALCGVNRVERNKAVTSFAKRRAVAPLSLPFPLPQ